ncbi:MAG: F0F1 ATP synthase subunit B [Chitinophagales bacterium]|nr:F0F1 ATP synthase subunit B [Chitinophagales bacterium]
MLLEINPLALPDIGLLFWNIVAFIVLFFVLKKMAWKPILKAIKTREDGIDEALSKAEKVKAEMAQLANENEALLQKAREERAVLIRDAKEQSDKMIAEAKEKAKSEYDRIVADAQVAINQQKNAALTDVKNQVGALVIEISEKILKRELNNKAEQENYIKQLAEEVKLN